MSAEEISSVRGSHGSESEQDVFLKNRDNKTLFGGRYRIDKKIGSGSFGTVYRGIDTKSGNGKTVAIKIEHSNSRHRHLKMESEILKELSMHSAGKLTVPIHYNFMAHSTLQSDGKCNVLIMELLGPNLEQLFHFCSRQFSMKTITLLAFQMVKLLQFIHGNGFIHRDVKPSNFAIGVDNHNKNRLYLIDFGLAKRFRCRNTGQHIALRLRSFTGTHQFASINSHRGIEQSRRDDMESLGYVLLYFCRGRLPWQGIKGVTKQQKYEKIAEKKMQTTVEELCKDLPPEFAMYLNYSKALTFEEEPDYFHCKKIFYMLLQKQKQDGPDKRGFDWVYVTLGQQKKSEEDKPLGEVEGKDKIVAATVTTALEELLLN